MQGKAASSIEGSQAATKIINDGNLFCAKPSPAAAMHDNIASATCASRMNRDCASNARKVWPSSASPLKVGHADFLRAHRMCSEPWQHPCNSGHQPQGEDADRDAGCCLLGEAGEHHRCIG